ncbi:aldo/keto reductase [Bacillus sp. P2(2020)]|uniref:Aldo/keto reductase n=1 Tax=Calidifontibacillus erzurumensis TaxID=2741433 RepID=A0A8J8GBJ4_9BACI|nr:aldo/keto reductase [Calidifontibacillus erzurumensis]
MLSLTNKEKISSKEVFPLVINSINDCAILHNGVKMPWLGLGVYKVQDGAEVIKAIHTAFEVGYRSVDTAAFYQNEKGVGQAVKEAGIPREQLFITTKVWNDCQGYEETLKAFEESRQKLGLDYIDLYLIHWPVKEKYIDTWRALEKLYQDGYVKAIGVCNFQVHHLQDLMKHAEIKPMVNQVEFHPCLIQKEVRSFCKENGIQLEAWAPLMRGRLMDDPTIVNIAKKYGKKPSQILLRWDLEHRVVTIPKSIHEERIKENADIFDFQLEELDVQAIDALNRNERTGPDPDNFSF